MKAYFVGIGGIGMSALAQLLKHDGQEVSGSDRTSSRVTELLEGKGISTMVGQRASNVPKDATVVVYSDAVGEDNPERAEAKALGIPQKSYFEMLGEVSKGKRTVAVAGTHGKTTTTGMLTKILVDAGVAPTAIIGSIMKDFGSNYVPGESDFFVVEACEYHDHLLKLSPEILVITNLEWDHTDWFPSFEAMQETFRKAVLAVPAHGVIVTNPSNPNIAAVLGGVEARIIDYTKEPHYALAFPGEFNNENARAAAAAARIVQTGISEKQLVDSLAAFQGTWRRFEYKGESATGATVYDDYAHHPTAVRATLAALRAQTKGKLYVAFHPHLFSRTRDLLEEFSAAFSDADVVFIAPIFAAREIDDGSISSKILAERILKKGTDAHALESFDAIEKALSVAGPDDLIVTMGAGDIYKVADSLVLK